MKIAVDLQSNLAGSRLGGIGRYSIELLKAMAKVNTRHEIWVLLSNLHPKAEIETREELSSHFPPDKIITFRTTANISELRNSKIKVLAAELTREAFILSLNPDILHITSLFEGLQEDIVTSIGTIFPAARTAVTLYDLIPLVHKDRYLADERAFDHYTRKLSQLTKAGLLLAISDYSRSEALNLLDYSAEKIINISSAADKKFKPLKLSNEDAQEVRKHFSIRDKFLMYTASFDQRKNHENLIIAYCSLPTDLRKSYQLLIVGNGWPEVYARLKILAHKHGADEDDIIFTGRIEDKALLGLYSLCHLFVFPSLFEGFGLPVLEAMSCGTATICSNTSCLPEVVGRIDATFDPTDPTDICRVMTKALTDDTFYSCLISDGINQARNFSWDISATRALEFMESHLDKLITSEKNEGKTSDFSETFNCNSNNSHIATEIATIPGISTVPDDFLREIIGDICINSKSAADFHYLRSGANSAMRIAFVTTWNTRCGIASYSRQLVKSFPGISKVYAPYADWTVEQDDPSVSRCWRSGGMDDLKELRKRIILNHHDAVVIQFNYGFFDFNALATFINYFSEVGIPVAITFHSTKDPSEPKSLHLIFDSLALCRAIFVHTSSDASRLRELGLSKIYLLPHGLPDVSAHDGASFPAVPRAVQHRFIATYGFALEGKGLTELLHAFSCLRALRRELYSDLKLIFVTAEYPDPQSANLLIKLKNIARELNILHNIIINSEYLKDEQSVALLKEAELIVYAYQRTGESSSAAVRMGIASGRPVYVTPLAIFEDVSSLVNFLPGTTPQEIALGLDSALFSENSVDTIDSSSRILWANAHNFGSIANYMYLSIFSAEPIPFSYALQPEYTLKRGSSNVVFSATSLPFRTEVGASSTEGISTTGKTGALIFGPYISVEPGRYTITINCVAINDTPGHAKLLIADENSQHIIREEIFDLSKLTSSPICIDFEILDHGCIDLETKILVESNASCLVKNIVFSSLDG